MELRLLVIRTAQLEKVVEFYTQLGLSFAYHRHGTGVYHYAATQGVFTFEIYPLQKHQQAADTSTRLGFAVLDFDALLASVATSPLLVSPPQPTEWGEMALLQDPDGRKVEIYRKYTT